MNKRLAISLGLLLTVVAQATEVTGVVRDGEGQPVEGAEIQILPTHTKTVTSDQDGAYQLTWQAEEWWDDDVVYYIVVRDQERQQAVALPIGKETISIDLTLQPALTLTGQVVDENGQGIGGSTIHVMMRASYWGSSLFNSSDSPTTDDQGHFEIGDLPPAVRYGLTASAKGYGTSDLDVSNTEEAQGGRLEVGKLTLTVANQKVSGRLIDQTGKPISGLTLRCYGDGQPDCEATTDAQGAFHFDALCEGPVTLNAHGRIEDQQISCRATTLAGTKDIELMAIPGQNMPIVLFVPSPMRIFWQPRCLWPAGLWTKQAIPSPMYRSMSIVSVVNENPENTPGPIPITIPWAMSRTSRDVLSSRSRRMRPTASACRP